ncbi:hypothetical protein EAH89_25990 [Roseomonas nepalensis]|uniref:UrcA family protein n=1 Tax=Muricoccus nepalensis TaxID=1854500 RepID=A0A502F8P6_9PROT|nr:hypothetical protein [Roseomonas nepalensis]TPG45729.1 hypothetical protein EAH89_25990 [Roseomonas nepalensis]
MITARLLGASALALGLALAAPAMAACTDAQAEAKMTELMNLMGPLMTRNAGLTETISTEMQTVMLQPVSDTTCSTYDRLIARARAAR